MMERATREFYVENWEIKITYDKKANKWYATDGVDEGYGDTPNLAFKDLEWDAEKKVLIKELMNGK